MTSEASREKIRRRCIWGRYSMRGHSVVDRWEDFKVIETLGSQRSAGRRARELNRNYDAIRMLKLQRGER